MHISNSNNIIVPKILTHEIKSFPICIYQKKNYTIINISKLKSVHTKEYQTHSPNIIQSNFNQ